MAAIIRVKRRLDEDPAESLIIQYKKRRNDGAETEEATKICLNLVTTVKSKDGIISRQMQKTLRRQELQTNYKAHESQRMLHARVEKRATAQASRYRIVNSKRTLGEDAAGSEGDSGATAAEKVSAPLDAGVGPAGDAGSGGALNSQSVTETGISGEVSHATGREDMSTGASDSDNAVVHLYDVEHDENSQSQHAPGSAITLNGQVLVSSPVLAAAENNFVYDLYYLNNDRQRYDFRDIENFLSIEAFHDEMTSLSERQTECEEVWDEDEDSNDEDNWRNDYPDHDPDYDDREEDYVYGMDHEELDREGSRKYVDRDDMFLADTLGTRLHLFGDSCDDDDDDSDNEGISDSDKGSHKAQRSNYQADEDSFDSRHETHGSSYDSFMRRVQRDLLQPDCEQEEQ